MWANLLLTGFCLAEAYKNDMLTISNSILSDICIITRKNYGSLSNSKFVKFQVKMVIKSMALIFKSYILATSYVDFLRTNVNLKNPPGYEIAVLQEDGLFAHSATSYFRYLDSDSLDFKGSPNITVCFRYLLVKIAAFSVGEIIKCVLFNYLGFRSTT